MGSVTDYTLILNYYNKSENLLHAQLDRVFQQTLPPKYIFGCFLGLPEENLNLIKAFKDKTKHIDNVFTICSDYNFKYIGRYQVALGAPTDYIIMLDDDRLPLKDYCRSIVSILFHDDYLVQNFGWTLSRKSKDLAISKSYLKDETGQITRWTLGDADKFKVNSSEGYAYRGMADMYGKYYSVNGDREKDGPRLIKADYLCGGICFRKTSLKYLFAEEIDPTTGEDIAFCLRAQKNGVPTVVHRPEDSHKGDDASLEHNSEGINLTLESEEMWQFRSRLIHKELGYPYGMDFEIRSII